MIKICTGDEAAECRVCLSNRMKRIGYELVTDRGDSIRKLEEKTYMYNKHSLKATEFIDDEEIKETLCFAQENKHNKELISSLIERAADCKGLTHREAAVLLECDLPEENEKMFTLAKQIKQKLYGNRIVMFAPLYLSNYCVNGCVYCPYHYKNKHIRRKS